MDFEAPFWMDNCENATTYELEMVRLSIDAALDSVENKDKGSTPEDITDTLKTALQLIDNLEDTFKKVDAENSELKSAIANIKSTQFTQKNDE